MPRVSVCMAAYNHEDYVGPAIQSVLDQTFDDWELVVTDDHSKDRTPEIIAGFKDPRIRFFRAERNRGIAETTENCVREARGDYLAILNSDDQYYPSKLERQVQFLDKNPEVAAVFTHTWFIDRRGGDYKTPFEVGFYSNRHNIFNAPNRSRHEWLNYFFHRGNCLCDPSVMARRFVYTEVAPPDPRFPITGDFNRWVRLCLKHEIHVLPEVLVKFRIHGKNASGQWLGHRPQISWEELLILRNYQEISDPGEFRRIFPEVAEVQPDPDLIPYYLARLALEKRSLTYRLFAVELLSRLFADAAKAAKLERAHGFTYRDLWALYKLV